MEEEPSVSLWSAFCAGTSEVYLRLQSFKGQIVGAQLVGVFVSQVAMETGVS